MSIDLPIDEREVIDIPSNENGHMFSCTNTSPYSFSILVEIIRI